MSWKRYLRKKNRYWKHLRNRNRHHLVPRSRGGSDEERNQLVMDVHKHELWHQLWGNRTIDEVLTLLTRMLRAKERLRYTRGAE
jgi:hypothetical protein